MKKIIVFVIGLFWSVIAVAQIDVTPTEGLEIEDSKTTTQLNAIVNKPNPILTHSKTFNNFVWWDVINQKWVEFSPEKTFNTPLIDTDNVIELDMSAFDWTQILTQYPNLDVDGTSGSGTGSSTTTDALPLTGGTMSGDINMASFAITSSNINAIQLTVQNAGTQYSGSVFSWGGSNYYTTTSANGFRWIPTDTESIPAEGMVYADDSDNRPKYYDGTSYKSFLLEGDVTSTSTSTADGSETIVTGDGVTGTGTSADPYVVVGGSTDDNHTGLNDPDLVARLTNPFNGFGSTTVVLIGDSTFDNSYSESVSYETYQVGKVGLSLYNNAQSGQNAEQWALNNGSNGTLANATANITGTGEDFVALWNFGINEDKSSEATYKANQNGALDALLAAKPDLKIVIIIPIDQATVSRAWSIELADARGLPYIDVNAEMDDVRAVANFFEDATHPSLTGTRRYWNAINDKLIPSDIIRNITLEEATPFVMTVEAINDGVYLRQSILTDIAGDGDDQQLAFDAETGILSLTSSIDADLSSLLGSGEVTTEETYGDNLAVNGDLANGGTGSINVIGSTYLNTESDPIAYNTDNSFRVAFEAKRLTGVASSQIIVRDNSVTQGVAGIFEVVALSSDWVVYTYDFQPVSGSDRINFQPLTNNGDYTGEIRNVSVIEIIPAGSNAPEVVTAIDVTYDNAASGLLGISVQAAIDELAAGSSSTANTYPAITSDNQTITFSDNSDTYLIYGDYETTLSNTMPIGVTYGLEVLDLATATSSSFYRESSAINFQFMDLEDTLLDADVVGFSIDENRQAGIERRATDVIKVHGLVTPIYSTEGNLITFSNAATDDTDSVLGFSEDLAEGDVTISSVATGFPAYAFMAEIVLTSSGVAGGAVISVPNLVIGDSYTVSITDQAIGSVPRIFGWQGVTTSPDITPTSEIIPRTITIVPTATTVDMYFYASVNATGVTGDLYRIYSLSLTKD